MHKARIATLLVVFLGVASSLALAQEPQAQPPMSAEQQAMMAAWQKAMTPGPQHKLLQTVVGEWSYTSKMWMDPAAPPQEYSGSSTYTSLMGGRFVQQEHRGVMMGMPFHGMGITGYDNVKQQYVATWIDNFGTMIFTMTGSYDEASQTFTYTGEMDDMMRPGTSLKVRQTLRMPDPDTQLMEWYEPRGGQEVRTMEMVSKRKK